MELVSCISKTSFVNQVVGSVNRKQKLIIPANLAKEFVSMGLVDYEGGAVKKPEVIQSKQSLEAEADGKAAPSASLPAETALPTNNLPKQKAGRRKKDGR